MNKIEKILLEQLRRHSTDYIESAERGIVCDGLDVDGFIEETSKLLQANGVDTGNDKCHIQNVNGWLLFNENEKAFKELIEKDGDCLIKFDDGTILRFNEENYPFSVVTHYKPF